MLARRSSSTSLSSLLVSLQAGRARWAALTAASTSAGLPSAIVAMGCSVAGLTTWCGKTPCTGGTHLPPIAAEVAEESRRGEERWRGATAARRALRGAAAAAARAPLRPMRSMPIMRRPEGETARRCAGPTPRSVRAALASLSARFSAGVVCAGCLQLADVRAFTPRRTPTLALEPHGDVWRRTRVTCVCKRTAS
eukprot:scaffold95455_cov60-Phaeocystis_antarctica.AAC.2